MPLDFPANPSDGQVYDGYYYDATIGAWQSNNGTQVPNIFKNVEYTTAQTYSTPLTVKGRLGQTADLQQWNDASGNTLAAIDDEGGLTLGNPLPISSGGTGSETGLNLVPTGCIMMWYTNTPPSGWIFCNGQSTSAYPNLATVVGSNVPNLQGRVPVGKSSETEFDTLGETGGSKTHTLTVDEMPSHTHTQNSHNHTQNPHDNQAPTWNGLSGSYEAATGGYGWDYPGGPPVSTTTATNNATTATNQNTGGGLAHNNLQPYIVLNYIIKT